MASRKKMETSKNEEREMHPKSLRLSGMLLISACPGLLFDEAVSVEHRRFARCDATRRVFSISALCFVDWSSYRGTVS